MSAASLRFECDPTPRIDKRVRRRARNRAANDRGTVVAGRLTIGHTVVLDERSTGCGKIRSRNVVTSSGEIVTKRTTNAASPPPIPRR